MNDLTPFGDLLEAARNGDGEAFRELWQRYARGVAAFCRSRGAEEPDEVTSDVFVSVFRRIGEFAGDEAAFRGFLFTVARRRLVDDVRRRGRRVPTSPWNSAADDRRVASAEDVVIGRRSDTAARDLLDGLTLDQRDVLVLRIFGELPLEQVAQILGKRLGAVKALQHRGLDSLRRNLRDHNEHTEHEGRERQ
ncbi:MAG: sigma-70 region 4 domain protein [Nocardioides sp.]|nr:sigma-70 region 4 domain protein [Nocardioides sp.]